MNLRNVYPNVKRSIVAFIPKVFPAWDDQGTPPPFPPIIGTGFIVREDGLIVTNNHVVRTFKKLQKHPNDSEDIFPVFAMLLRQVDEGILEMPLEVIGVAVLKSFKSGGAYYGPPIPDIAYVHVKVTGLPTITVDAETSLEEGMDVATAGFPMGRDALTAPGWLHQINPTLQRGIISAVLPFPGPSPHAFAVNVTVQGGASGSPVFLPETGAVIGMLYAGLGDVEETYKGDFVRVPTSISHAIPAHYLANFLREINQDEEIRPPDDARTLEEIIASAKFVRRDSDEQFYEPLYDDGEGGLRLAIRPASKTE